MPARNAVKLFIKYATIAYCATKEKKFSFWECEVLCLSKAKSTITRVF